MPETISEGRKRFFELIKHKVHQAGIQKIKIAYQISKYGHKGQKRDDGTRYFEHPKECAFILIKELAIYDYEMICALLLHDIKEDSFILDFDDIEFIFGPVIRHYVELLTKIDDENELKVRTELDYHRRLYHAEEKVQILKLVDRLHNLRTLNNCKKQKQIKIIRETIEIFLPMAKEVNEFLYKEMKKICDKYRRKYPQSFTDLKGTG